jgi:putative heme-binding domain-containing protein
MVGFMGVGRAVALDREDLVLQDRTARTDVGVTKNPLEGNRDAIRDGGTKFRSRCAGCHGPDAHGYIGPDIAGLSASGYTDGRMFGIVRRGVPGTEMTPADPLRVPDREIWQILAYLGTLTAAPSTPSSGDAQNGERIFRANCSSCHIVNGRGGQLGPDLSRVGSGRSRPVLLNKVRGTSDNIRPGYEAVTIVTRDGQRIRGVKKNEDEFSIQIIDMRERLQGYLKANVTEILNEPRTVMPAYGAGQLNDGALDDLLQYLGTLRRADADRR